MDLDLALRALSKPLAREVYVAVRELGVAERLTVMEALGYKPVVLGAEWQKIVRALQMLTWGGLLTETRREGGPMLPLRYQITPGALEKLAEAIADL